MADDFEKIRTHVIGGPAFTGRYFHNPNIEPAPSSVTSLPPRKTDAERAAEIKKQMLEALVPVMALLDEAYAAGFIVDFSVGRGPVNRYVVTGLKVSKEF